MTIGNRVAPVRFLAFAAGMLACVVIAIAAGMTVGLAVMLGFDIAAIAFLASLWPLLDDESDAMRRRAKANDANRAGLLALTFVVTVVILVAIANELSGKPSALKIALVIATLALAWLFSNSVYALHYAHMFYLAGRDGKDAGGLDVPETSEPDYWDFMYFSFTLGMTFQTSDVEIRSAAIRRVTIGHCLAAFVFNLGILAFTINVLGS